MFDLALYIFYTDMFPILCLVTFTLFTTLWLIQLIYTKTTTYLQQRNTAKSSYKIKINTCEDIDEDEIEPMVQSKQKQNENISKVTNISDNPSKFASIIEVINSNVQVGEGASGVGVGGIPELSVRSDGNQLDVAMIEENVSNIQDKEGRRDNPVKQEDYQGNNLEIRKQSQVVHNSSNILSLIAQTGVDKPQQEGPKQDQEAPQDEVAEQQQEQQEIAPTSPHQTHQQKQPKDQRSQLEIIQALSTHKSQVNLNTNSNPNHNNNPNFQIEQISQVQTKQKESDGISSKLMQEIDELFLTNQQQFMNILNKYKVQEARYGVDSQFMQSHEKEKYQEEIQRLEREVRRKSQDIDLLEIGISQYKAVCQAKEIQIQGYKQTIQELERNISKLKAESRKQYPQPNSKSNPNSTQLLQQLQKQTQYQNKQISSYQKILKQHQQIQEAYQKSQQKLSQHLLHIKQKQQEINKLTAQLNSSKQQISRLYANLQSEKSNNSKMMQEYSQLQRDYDHNLEVIQNLRNQIDMSKKKEGNNLELKPDDDKNRVNEIKYMEKLAQFEREIERIRDQATNEKKKYDELLTLYNQQLQLNSVKQQNAEYVPFSTRQNLTQSRQDELNQLEQSHQNLKNQIQFAQTQIRMFEETQASYIKQIQQLQNQKDSISKQNSELRSKLSRMQPVVNEYDIMQRRYFELKLKYQKLLHERPQLNNSGSSKLNQSRKRQQSIPAFQISPKNIGITKINVDSPISNKSNDNNNKKNSPTNIGGYRFLFDCSFIGLQDRDFVYETIRSLLKGVLKTQKLYNSRTNKAKNPHDLIDNIRGVLLLIHLQNDKILGAYTHESFSSLHPQSTPDNIAFIFDVTNRRSFVNQSGLNSITYNPHNIVWGFNEIMLKYEESEVMYTNFCRNHNIYWDGKYRIEDFIGSDKQWARINQYEIFRVTKI